MVFNKTMVYCKVYTMNMHGIYLNSSVFGLKFECLLTANTMMKLPPRLKTRTIRSKV
jgi:hypothetical protein